MNDCDVIKALKCCLNFNDCSGCPEFGKGNNCVRRVIEGALNLIKRQQAEIWRLTNENAILSINADNAFQEGLNENRQLFKNEVEAEIKSEARKEFAERLCEGRVSNDPVRIAVMVELEMMEKENNDV